jgi:2'-5' RNA ligase
VTRARERTALVLPVPEAEHLLRPWRAVYTDDGRLGMWAHLTLLHPFLEPHEVAGEIGPLRAHLSRLDPFPFVLAEPRRFPGGLLYLAPEPEERFRELLADAHAPYPDRPPYGGIHDDVVPHCTVAASDEEAVLDAAETALRPHLPLAALASEAWLVELKREGWSVRARLPFRG